MAAQRDRARKARGAAGADGEATETYRELLEQFGPTEFVGYSDYEAKARVLAMVGDEVFLDRTPFYAESGGQVGDTGTITTDTGTAIVKVLDKKEVTPAEWTAAKDKFRDELVTDRRSRFFSAYMVKAKQKMKIEINRDTLEKAVS